MPAAVVSPCTCCSVRIMAPAPRNPTPATTPCTMRVGAKLAIPKLRIAWGATSKNIVEPMHTRVWVRRPAGLWAICRCSPTSVPSTAERSMGNRSSIAISWGGPARSLLAKTQLIEKAGHHDLPPRPVVGDVMPPDVHPGRDLPLFEDSLEFTRIREEGFFPGSLTHAYDDAPPAVPVQVGAPRLVVVDLHVRSYPKSWGGGAALTGSIPELLEKMGDHLPPPRPVVGRPGAPACV